MGAQAVPHPQSGQPGPEGENVVCQHEVSIHHVGRQPGAPEPPPDHGVEKLSGKFFWGEEDRKGKVEPLPPTFWG
jgi:hypothetical protein